MPEMGRLITQDPAKRASAYGYSESQYAYVQNCSVNRIDPTGLYDSSYCARHNIQCITSAATDQSACQLRCGWDIGFCGGIPAAIACGITAVVPNPYTLALCLGLGVGSAVAFALCWRGCGREYQAVSERCEIAYWNCIRFADDVIVNPPPDFWERFR
ncbi:MAG: hypothetical protein JSV65_08350 [Armatimonadota bacterium]|nr:MAG: hypothetical protein JSV65_08350 [Armatimonadota bacterium]